MKFNLLVTLFIMAICLGSQLVVGSCCAGTAERPVFRIGFSRATIGPVNENDAMAAVRIWAEKFAIGEDIAGDAHPVIFDGVEEVKQALLTKNIECIDLTMDQYLDLQDLLDKDHMLGGVVSGSMRVEYVVLVHREKPFQVMADLRGGSVLTVTTLYHALALHWLDNLLVSEGMPRVKIFFSSIGKVGDVRDAVLPVFFKQADSCVVTKKSYQILAELNPQIARQLRVVAVSPPVIPSMFAFRRGFESPVIDKVMREASRWHLNISGRQILTIFKTDSLQRLQSEDLEPTLELLSLHKKLAAATFHITPNPDVDGGSVRK